MADIVDKVMDIAASLWIEPASLEVLAKKEFLEGISQYSVYTIVNIGKSKGWIYEKNDVYYTYKKCVIEVLNPKGYELYVKTDTRSDFEKAVAKALKRQGF